MEQEDKRLRLVGILTLVALSGIITISLAFRQDGTKDDDGINPFHDKYGIYSLDLPDSVSFAGESMPLEDFDVRERFDRELLVNTYWQSQTLLFIKKSNRYFRLMEPILAKYGVPDDFKYLALAESGLSHVVSPMQAVGFWQIREGAARDYGLEVNDEVDERYHIEKSTEAACKYLLDSYRLYGNWTMAAASYNLGRTGLNRQINRQKVSNYYDLLLNEETGRYVFRIAALKTIISHPEKYGFYVDEKEMYQPVPWFEVTVDTSINDFAGFAARYDITYKVLKIMNPWLRDKTLSNKKGKKYVIKIPGPGYYGNYSAGLAPRGELPEDEEQD